MEDDGENPSVDTKVNMDYINFLIEMCEKVGIRCEVDQSFHKNGNRTIDVYIYDTNDEVVMFEFDAKNSNLIDFKVLQNI